MGVMNPVTGRIFDRYGARWLAIIGFFILTVTTFLFTMLTPTTTFLFLASMNAIRMFAISMVMMPVTTAGLNQLPRDLIPHGTSMNNTFRQVSGAIGTAILVTVMATGAIPSEGIPGLIRGVNMSFYVATGIALLGLILSLFMRNSSPNLK